MSDISFLDNDFLLVKADEQIASPIGVLNYETYNDDSTYLAKT